LLTMGNTAWAQDTVDCAAPNVLLVFDVSGSMGKAIEGTKYTLAANAITQATQSLDQDVRFGLLMFPDPNGMYCDLDPTPQIDFELDNGPAIFSLLDPAGATFWGGPTATHDTPMYQALVAAGELSELKNPERRNYVVLITDGNQDCCNAGDYDDEDDCEPDSTVLEAVEKAENIADLEAQVGTLVNNGIRTFVVGLQDGVSAAALNKMAIAGLTPKSPDCNGEQDDPSAADNCYYTADDTGQLQAALQAITQIISEESCDGLDNDCNGEVDELWPSLGASCDGPDTDSCSEGTTVCAADTVTTTCEELTPAHEELCNGFDEDCDGSTDEDWPDLGAPCDGDDPDECANGLYQCNAAGIELECAEGGTGFFEECNGTDDDCNGQTDEGVLCDPGFSCLGGVCILDAVDEGDPDPPAVDTQDSPDEDTGGVTDSPDTGPIALNPDTAGPDIQGGGLTGAGNNDTATSDGGCGCQKVGPSRSIPAGGLLFVLALVGLFAWLRRRPVL